MPMPVVLLADGSPTRGRVESELRHGSVKRVASAVGEGSIAIHLLHTYLRDS